jgi:HK97 family phage prohead protease
MPHEQPIEHKSVAFEFKASPDDAGAGGFEGLGGVFFNIDAVDDIIAPGAFADALPEFLSAGFIGGLNHDWNTPIGHPASARETPEGLVIKAVFDNTPEAQAVRAMMTPHPETGRATIKKLSIGYKTIKALPLDSPDDVKAYWAKSGYTPNPTDLARAEKAPIRLLTKLKLIEVSPVLNPANDLARTTGVKSAESADFARHSRKVASAAGEFLSDVEAFLGRYESRAEARSKAGRELSSANWNALKDVHDRHMATRDAHAALCDRMAAILDRTKPGGRAKSGDVVPPGMSAAEEADLMARFAQIMYATDPTLR